MGEATWTEVAGRGDRTLLVPLGSMEQHGPHLPLNTDALIAAAVAERAGAELDLPVAPVVAFGASGEHADFAGTLSIGTDALRMLIVELVRSASLTFDRVVLVNGHGGNHDAVTTAVKQLADEGHDVLAWSPRVAGGDAHAGRTETSLMLAITPGLVRSDLAEPGNTAPLVDLIDDMRSGGVRAVAPNGVLGDPTGASAAEGHDLLTALVADLISIL